MAGKYLSHLGINILYSTWGQWDYRLGHFTTFAVTKMLLFCFFPLEIAWQNLLRRRLIQAKVRASTNLTNRRAATHARTHAHAREQDVRRGESAEVQASVGSGSTMKWTRRVYAGGRRWQVINAARRVSIRQQQTSGAHTGGVMARGRVAVNTAALCACVRVCFLVAFLFFSSGPPTEINNIEMQQE